MVNNYLDKVIHLSKNYKFISLKKEYKFGDYENAHVINRPSFFLNDLLIKGTYTIKGTNKIFHKKEIVDILTSMDKETYLDDLTNIPDNTILQLELHPSNRDFLKIKNNFFDNFFNDFPLFLEKLKKSKSYIFINFGFEADSFLIDDYNQENHYKNYYEMFEKILSDWNLPSNSMIILSSNALGYEQEKIRYNSNPKVKCIFENATEMDTFCKLKTSENLEYTFDEHIENLKKSSKYLLRINRTSNQYRDLMIYYLFSSGNHTKSLIEHFEFSIDDDKLKSLLKECFNISNKLNLNLGKYFEYNSSIVDNIKTNLPLVASQSEKVNDELVTDSYGLEPIPHDVYKKSIFSWVSTSLLHAKNQIFINASTFNPMLYYHPLLIHGNKSHLDCLKKYNYKSFSFLFDEEYDNDDGVLVRFVKNVNEIDKLLELPKDILIKKLVDNKNVLEYNRKTLFECNSIENILSGFYNLVNGYESRTNHI